jgi:predicted enzyme related to lactoylglutathione lyase
MTSAFCHHELNTSDPAAARNFYKSMFGWKFQDMPMPGGGAYSMFTTGQNEGGGIQQHPMPGAPSAWLQYILVPSVKKAMAKGCVA